MEVWSGQCVGDTPTVCPGHTCTECRGTVMYLYGLDRQNNQQIRLQVPVLLNSP